MRQKCDCRFGRRTCVEDNSELIPSGIVVSGKHFKRRVFNMADEGTERRSTFISQENLPMEREG